MENYMFVYNIAMVDRGGYQSEYEVTVFKYFKCRLLSRMTSILYHKMSE